MTSLPDLRRQFVYDAWANRETLRSLVAAGGAPGRGVALLAHIIGAQQVWLDRLQKKPVHTPVWPEWTVDQCERELEASVLAWTEHLEGMSERDLEGTSSYLNSKGEPWSSKVSDVLTHVVMHGVYHRGQIAAAVRAAGFTPAYTDFIHASRQGLI